MNQTQVEDLLTLLGDVYDETFDDPRIDRWVRALAPADPDHVAVAAEQYMAEQPRFFPKPAEIVNRAEAIALADHGTVPKRAGKRIGDLPPEARERIYAGCIERYNRRHPETAEIYPPEQFPGTGPLRFLYAAGKLHGEQLERFEARLQPHERLTFPNRSPQPVERDAIAVAD